MTLPGGKGSARECIICGTPTTDRSGAYKHPRCADWLPCALRRNQAKARPKPVSKIVAEAIEKGLTIPPELALFTRKIEREAV